MVSTKRFTIEDLEARPDNGHAYELIDGELVRREPLTGWHGAMQSHVGRRIGLFVEERGLGEVFGSDTIYAFRRDPDWGLKPDVSFVRAGRLSEGSASDKPLNVVPDLVVEVLSPDERLGVLEDKLETYHRFGLPLVWVFWPRRKAITVYTAGRPVSELHEGDELDGGEVLPGFRVAVADLFDVGR